jgi:hypothetical protein
MLHDVDVCVLIADGEAVRSLGAMASYLLHTGLGWLCACGSSTIQFSEAVTLLV